jgi:hypothetical protein
LCPERIAARSDWPCCRLEAIPPFSCQRIAPAEPFILTAADHDTGATFIPTIICDDRARTPKPISS